MSRVSLTDRRGSGAVTVSSLFIRTYMPRANGEFVKIYLMLLELLSSAEEELSVGTLADLLACTEKDILRGLRWWETAGLIALEWEKKELTSIALLPIQPEGAASRQGENRAENISAAAEDGISVPGKTKATGNGKDNIQPADPSADPGNTEKQKATRLPQLSSSRVKELCQGTDPNIEQITYVAEQYLGRMLSPTDLNRLLYFYDELHFSVDLLDYLIEYCVSRGKKSMAYIQKVGFAWYEDHIITVSEARERTSAWRREYYAFLKAYGVRNREPLNSETEFFDRWLREYGFSQELICAACERTVRSTGKMSLEYTEKILTRWKAEKVSSLKDVQAIDERFRSGSKKNAAGKEKAGKNGDSTGNRFHNFKEREYDYEKLEAELFRKQFPDA